MTAPAPGWETVIGLEVHAQVASRTKLFSTAPVSFGEEPNQSVSLVDAAMPGMLPVLNRFCVEQAVRTALALGATVHPRSIFDRKNYFYPDLPQGYQISQYSDPIATGGGMEILTGPDGPRQIRIVRLHIEQDAGKSTHDREPGITLVDLNRAGVALMEIVTEPDLRTDEEAGALLRGLRAILRTLGTCGGNMERSELRADVNVSVRRLGAELGTRCEIKNLNSIRFMQQAIRFEAQRQIEILEEGGSIRQETRLFDPTSGRTRTMRGKEEAEDYRYFPDPDLPPLELDPAWIESIRASLPELPVARQARFVSELGLPAAQAAILAEDPVAAEYFEKTAQGREAKTAAHWIVNELFAHSNRTGTDIADCPVSPTQLGAIIDLTEAGTISGTTAKELLGIIWEEGGDPAELVAQRNLGQVTDTSALEADVERVLAANPEEVARAQKKPTLAGWFVGQVMKESGGRADPKQVGRLVREKLGIDEPKK